MKSRCKVGWTGIYACDCTIIRLIPHTPQLRHYRQVELNVQWMLDETDLETYCTCMAWTRYMILCTYTTILLWLLTDNGVSLSTDINPSNSFISHKHWNLRYSGSGIPISLGYSFLLLLMSTYNLQETFPRTSMIKAKLLASQCTVLWLNCLHRNLLCSNCHTQYYRLALWS